MSQIIKEKFNYYRQHWFIRNVATLQVGNFAGIIFQAVAGVFIARLLQPELFGVYSLVFSLAGLAGLLLGAGTQEAVSTLLGSAYAKRDREEIGEVLAFLLKMTFYAGIVTLGLLFFLPWLAGYFYGNSMIGWYASIVVAGVFLSSSFTSVVQLSLQVVGKIKILTLVIFGDQFFRFGLTLLLIFMGFGVWGAVSGQFIGAFLLFIISIFIWEKLKSEYSELPTLRSLIGRTMRISIKKYFRFSLWVAIDRNMSNLYMTLPVVLTGIYVSTGELSFFKLAFGFVNLALSLLGPISTLLNIEFSKMRTANSDRLGKSFIRVSLYGLGLSTLLTLGAIIISPVVFRILYGESFAASIQYISGLLIYGALFGIGVGLGPMWRAINKVKISILINTIILGIGIPVGILLVKSYGNWGAIVMVTLWFSASHLTSFIYLSQKLKKQF